MSTLLCAAQQADTISLPSAIYKIQITNYSWTHERNGMKLCLKHQLGYNKCTLLPFMPSKFMTTQSSSLTFFSGKEEKKVKSSPYLAVATFHQETAPELSSLEPTAELFLTRTHQRNHRTEI